MANSTRSETDKEREKVSAAGRIWATWISLFKIIWLSFWLGIATILVTVPILSLSIFRVSSNTIFSFVRLWARIILSISGVTLIVSGKDKLEKNQSYVIISNHQSHFDGPALAASLGIQFGWIAKKELLNIPLMGQALKASGTIFIDRGDRETAMQSISECVEHLPTGAGIMVFAEGTRSEHGIIGKFKKGGFIAAIQTGFPIVPVTIKGSSLALPKGGVIFHPGTIEVKVGDIVTSSNYSLDQMDELVEKTRNIIVSNYQ